MSCKSTNCSSFFLMLFKLLLFLILYSADLVASRSCRKECGGIVIPYPFGIGNGCYLDKYYDVECRKTSTSGKVAPCLSAISKEVVSITLPNEERDSIFGESFGFVSPQGDGVVCVKMPITSTGCSRDGKESARSVLNLTGSPFFSDNLNSLIAVGCKSRVSLTHIKPNIVGCELNCKTSRNLQLNSIPFLNKTGCVSHVFSYTHDKACREETGCGGNGCCQAINLTSLSKL